LTRIEFRDKMQLQGVADDMSCHKATLERLQQQGIRVTVQRSIILEDLFHSPGHRTAEAIYQHVSDRLPGLNLATVYRTLELLRDAGLIVVYPRKEGVTEFELVRTGGDLHHHLICRRCGTEYALDAEPVEALKAAIADRFGFHADLDHIAITGLCARCQESCS
jgi:Fur family transcriptional regulator, ferric uptake regulator